jgi:hypothetical protein
LSQLQAQFDLTAHQGAFMNREKFKAICAKAIVAAVTASGLLALGTQAASAQAITATVPFAFSAGDQPFPSGTYQFTFLSGWFLSIRNVKGGGEKFFTTHPQQNGSQASRARIVFRNSGVQKKLEAVYLSKSDGGAELLSSAGVSPKLQSLAQNATLR